MNANTGEWNSSGYLFGSYRVFRRGILTPPQLEETLKSDIKAISAVVDRGKPSIEPEFAVQIISSAKELVEETLTAAIVLRQFVEADKLFGDMQAMEQLAAKKILDSEVRAAVIRTIHVNDGIRGLIGREQDRLRQRLRAYSESLEAALGRNPESLNAAFGILDTFYENQFIRELNYWRKKLEDAKNPAARFEVILELCSSAPQFASLLGVQCSNNIPPWPVVLIAVACAILCSSG